MHGLCKLAALPATGGGGVISEIDALALAPRLVQFELPCMPEINHQISA